MSLVLPSESLVTMFAFEYFIMMIVEIVEIECCLIPRWISQISTLSPIKLTRHSKQESIAIEIRVMRWNTYSMDR